MQVWQMAEAKAQLGELVRCANEQGPQEITVHNRPAAIVMSVADYQRQFAPATAQGSLLDFLRASPLFAAELELERDRSLPREFSL
ncbi:type II toxin-antitoxin system Phd/YefM family antitoxin [Uliginosibacterium sediminicola]|uniref:Antitoxin n=1 Tax=Uliginosibacterium sediminicola TaxID=2024550 RepID=A0ABU9YZP3_9RHOO